MLFDLRSRGRRRTVQFVYLGLAVLMGGGLVLFGVGSGTSGGGLLNGLSGSGSGNSGGALVSAQEKTALKATKSDPTSASAWASLVSARWSNASAGNNYNSATGTFTTAGKKELTNVTRAWERYLTLTKTPDPNLAILAARAYGALANYAAEASAWEIQAAADPSAAKGYECLAASAYAAQQTRKGDLALAKALSLVPKLTRATLKSSITAAKTTPTVAQSC